MISARIIHDAVASAKDDLIRGQSFVRAAGCNADGTMNLRQSMEAISGELDAILRPSRQGGGGGWSLARTVPVDKRESLRQYVVESLVLSLAGLGACEGSWVRIEEHAARLRLLGISRGFATSLVSKLAYHCFPDVFSPYDRYCLIGLNKFVSVDKQILPVPPHCYRAFMTSFLAVAEDIAGAEKLAGRLQVGGNLHGIVQRYFPGRADIELLIKRIVDKYLMVSGGFSELMLRPMPKDLR